MEQNLSWNTNQKAPSNVHRSLLLVSLLNQTNSSNTSFPLAVTIFFTQLVLVSWALGWHISWKRYYRTTQCHILEDCNPIVKSVESTVFVFLIAAEFMSVNRIKHWILLRMLLFSCACDIWKMGQWQCYRVLFFSCVVLLRLRCHSALRLVLCDIHTLYALCVLYILQIKKLKLDFLNTYNRKRVRRLKRKLMGPI
jgi:hypothetical protein